MTILSRPDNTTAAKAASQESPSFKHTYETKKVVIDGAGATAKGSFAQSPISKVAKDAEITVAKKAALIFIPDFANKIGFKRNTYESVRKVESPALNSTL